MPLVNRGLHPAAVMAAALLAWSGGAPAAAQIVVAATASGAIDGAIIPPAECSQSFTVGVPAACVRSGAAGNFFQAFARADEQGALRGTASATGATGSTADTVGSAGASWTERVFYTAQTEPIFGYLEIEMRGVQDTSFAGSGRIGASTAAFMQMGIYRDGRFDLPQALDQILLVRRLDDSGDFRLHSLGRLPTVRGVDGDFEFSAIGAGDTAFPFTLSFELDPGSEFYDWNWRFAINAIMAAGAEGFAHADYSSTFLIRTVGFRNSQGQDITRRLDVRFGSGAAYPLAAIPEPAIWAMLIAGFGLVGGVLRRRRPVDLAATLV